MVILNKSLVWVGGWVGIQIGQAGFHACGVEEEEEEEEGVSCD
jgi:hypothetical protein